LKNIFQSTKKNKNNICKSSIILKKIKKKLYLVKILAIISNNMLNFLLKTKGLYLHNQEELLVIIGIKDTCLN